MALPYTPLNIDVLDLEKDGLYPSFTSTTKIAAPATVRSNGLYLAIRAIAATNSGTPPWGDVSLSTATVSASIDIPDLLPSQGSWTASFGGYTTSLLAYNIGSSNLQNALNALVSITAAGGVTVVQTTAEDDFIITFNSNGAQANISGASFNLYPASSITSITDQTGTANLPAVQTLSLQQLPATFQNVFTAFPGAGYTCIVLTAGGAGVNNLQLLTLNPIPYAGTFTITTAYGTSGPIQWSAVGNDIATALNAIPTTPGGTWLASGGSSGSWNITNTTGTSISALTATLAGLSVPIGVTGELNLSTPGMISRFNTLPSTATSLAAELEIAVQFPGQDPQTILLVPVTVMRSVINPNAIVSPTYPSALTKLTGIQTGFGTITALSSGAGTLSGLVTANDAMPVGAAIIFYIGSVTTGYFFRSGTDATTTGIQRPDDFNATTNAFVWVQFL